MMNKVKIYTIAAFLGSLYLSRLFSYAWTPRVLEWSNRQEDMFSRQYLSWLKNGENERMKGVLNSTLLQEASGDFPRMREDFNRLGGIQALHLLNVSYLTVPSIQGKVKQLSYFADFEKGSLLLQVGLHKGGNDLVMDEFQYKPVPGNYQKISQFGFGGKPIFYYLFLSAAILVAGLTLFTFARCLQSPIVPKWFWLPFVLLGFGKLGLVWNGTSPSDSVPRFKFAAVQLLSSGIIKGGVFEPWTIWISFPAGALFFYYFRGLMGGKK